MIKFKALKKSSLASEVEQQIKESIISGKFNTGDKLPSEREMVEQFRVSRVTIREALRSIQHLGLISIKRGIQAGAYVSDPNSDSITRSFQNLISMGKVTSGNLIDVRLMIEPEVAKIAAIQHTDEDVVKVKELLDQAESRVPISCKEARLINVHFHNEVAKIIKNPIVLFISESITQIYSAVIIEITRTEISREKALELIKEHRSILFAITERDGENAWRLTREHLVEVREMYADILLSGNNEMKAQSVS
jgi:GntR family transcriptional regulator, transcriptional repressor for pyruvate dehydrogenase complex